MGFIWLYHRILTKWRYPPVFHGWSFAKIIAIPSCIGCFLASIPFLLCGLIIYSWLGNFDEAKFSSNKSLNDLSLISLEPYHGSWLDTHPLDNDMIKHYRVGRLGTALLAMGLFATLSSANLIITDNEKKQRSYQGDGNKYKHQLDNNNNKEKDIRWRWKRNHLVWVSLSFELLLLCLWEFSYSSQFEGA